MKWFLKYNKWIQIIPRDAFFYLEFRFLDSNKKFIKSIVLITSDKCYENIGKVISYNEDDLLGGTDPYSASKAAAEIAFKSLDTDQNGYVKSSALMDFL